ncbi:MAG: hypothetical protein R2710_05530 [Acidimicrobiales bacterium]
MAIIRRSTALDVPTTWWPPAVMATRSTEVDAGGDDGRPRLGSIRSQKVGEIACVDLGVGHSSISAVAERVRRGETNGHISRLSVHAALGAAGSAISICRHAGVVVASTMRRPRR